MSGMAMHKMNGSTETNISPTQARERVYFVQAEGGGPIKIGRATDVERRVADLQRYSPLPLHVLAVAEGGSALETRLHQRFANTRKHGEWFEPSESIMAVISEYAAAGDAPQNNKVVQLNMRAPESSRDLLHEICRRLRHESGFEGALREYVSGECGHRGNERLDERLRTIEQRLSALEGSR